MPPIKPESIIGLPDYKIISCQGIKTVEIIAEYTGSIGTMRSVLVIQTHKFCCRDCGKYFNQRLPGVLPYQRSTEPFKDEVSLKHHDGISVLKVSKRLGLGEATVGRYYRRYLQREFNEH
jgi:hypothetical protein